MKKIIVILVIIACISSFLFIPVSAAETDNVVVNVLDFSSVDGTGNNSVSFNSSRMISISFVQRLPVYAVEFTVGYSGSTPSIDSVLLQNNITSERVSVSYISNNMYKYRITFSGTDSNFCYLNFVSSGRTTLYFYNFYVYTSPNISEPLSASLVAGNLYNFTGSYSMTQFTDTSSMQISIDSWRAYDHVSLTMYLGGIEGFNSINAYLRDNYYDTYYPLKLSLNPVFPNTELGGYNLSLDIDLTELNKVLIGDATLIVNFNFSNYVTAGTFSVLDLSGFFFTSGDADPTISLFTLLFRDFSQYFIDIYDAIYDTYYSIESKLDELFGSSADISQDIENIQSSADSVQSDNEQLSGTVNEALDDLNTFLPDLINDVTSYLPTTGSLVSNVFVTIYDAPLLSIYFLILSLYIIVYILFFRG